ncbi:MAG: NAD(P)-dependent glycerol-3-phosphate dehydrogenase [Candidatus Portiera sp.]|nr:NAD(P)-dependent glycerol-3-phosphate dehydrogenase [Portiera sp.]
MTNLKVAVLGGGSFGTVLANISAANKHQTTIWMRDQDQVASINNTHRNSKYISDLQLADDLVATSDLSVALENSQIIILALPSKAFPNVVERMMPHLTNQYLISATKGIAEDKFMLMSELLVSALKRYGLDPSNRIGVLSGPNIAKEIAAKHLTGSVIASTNKDLNLMVRQTLSTKYLHIFDNEDIYGVELAGSLKNIYAIAAGISDSLGFGINTKSVLISRSISEMVRFASCMNAKKMTFTGLASIGDLIATCSSVDSRNYRLGKNLIGGDTIEEICARLGGVAEGIHTTKMTYQKAQELNISMPLLEGVYRIIFNREKVKNVLWKVLVNTPYEDVEHVNIGDIESQSNKS